MGEIWKKWILESSRVLRGEKNGCLLVGFGGRKRWYWGWRGVGGGEEERKTDRIRVEEEERIEKKRRGAWHFFNQPASTVITVDQPLQRLCLCHRFLLR